MNDHKNEVSFKVTSTGFSCLYILHHIAATTISVLSFLYEITLVILFFGSFFSRARVSE